MQRLLHASTRASCRGRPAKYESIAAPNNVAATGSEADASAQAAFSSPALSGSTAHLHHGASVCPSQQHIHISVAPEASSIPQRLLSSFGDLSRFPCQAPAVQWCTGRDTYTGNLGHMRLHIFSPLGAPCGRQAFTSAAQAASSVSTQHLFPVRQASNERPAVNTQRKTRNPGKRAAIIACLARSLEELGYVNDESTLEGAAAQHKSCREVSDSMTTALKQGAPDRAMRLFALGFLQQEGGWESAFMCDALLKACAMLGEIQLSLLTVKSMHALGIPVGYVAHGSVLTGLSRAGRVQEALHYLREEVSAEAQTAGMYNSILEAALYDRNTQIAYEALELMQDAAVTPDSRTAAAALRIMGTGRTVGAVHTYWAKLHPELKQHVAVHAAHVDALCMSVGLPEALKALERMLDICAAQHSQDASQSQSEQFPDLNGTLPASKSHSHQGTLVSDDSKMFRDPFQSHMLGQQAVSQMQREGDTVGLENSEQSEGGREMLRWGSSVAAEESSVAHRAAQAACHQVLNTAAKAGLANVSNRVLQAMHQAGVQPDTAIYNSIMRQQAAARMGPSALEQTLSDMETHGLQPDRRSLFVLLREYGRRGDLAGAMTVMRRMAQLDIIPDRFTYNILLEAHTAADDLEGVANVYKAMTSRAVQPDICTFVALFQSLKGCSNSAGLMQSEQSSWLQRMRGSAYVAPHELLAAWRTDFEASGLQHTPASFTALVQALGQTQQIEGMLQLLAHAWAGQAAQRPSIYACNSAIGACARAGRLDDALRLCSAMEKQGLRADMYTYSLLMNGYALARRPDMAFKLFDQMHEQGVKANVYIYNALIKAQASSGDICQVVAGISEKSLRHSMWNADVTKQGAEDQLKGVLKALHLFDAMIDAGVRPDGASWQTLLSQSKYLGRPDVTELVQDRMQGKIQQWPQHVLEEARPIHFDQLSQGELNDQQPLGYEERDEDDDEDMFGGPRF